MDRFAYGPSDYFSVSLGMHFFYLPPIPSYTLMNFHIPGRALGFYCRDSRGDWHLYRWPSADDRRGFSKPGRCIKHNRHVVFLAEIAQSCGKPSFPVSYSVHCLSSSGLATEQLISSSTSLVFSAP